MKLSPGQTNSVRQLHGTVTVLTAVVLVVVLAFVAFSVDIAYLCHTKAQLQHAVDAAALGACLELKEGLGTHPLRSRADAARLALSAAKEISAQHRAGPRQSIQVVSDGVHFETGYRVPGAGWQQVGGEEGYNVVRVNSGFEGDQNLRLFFAPVLGIRKGSVQASATAAILPASGFRLEPNSKGTVPLLPFTYDLENWLKVESNVGVDEWQFDSDSQEVRPGPDGVPEFNLYPEGNKKLPSGNRGTVSLGAPASDTPSIRRWILTGANAQDLAWFGGELGNSQCPIEMDGITGVRATLQTELEEIRGQVRAIPIFSEHSGNGTNARYTVVRFVGVRILDVDLKGGNKHLTVQPSVLIHPSAVTGGDLQTNLFRSPQLIH